MPTPATVLVIDDSAEFRLVLREALDLDGYRVIEAGDGRDRIAHFSRKRPELRNLSTSLRDIPFALSEQPPEIVSAG